MKWLLSKVSTVLVIEKLIVTEKILCKVAGGIFLHAQFLYAGTNFISTRPAAKPQPSSIHAGKNLRVMLKKKILH